MRRAADGRHGGGAADLSPPARNGRAKRSPREPAGARCSRPNFPALDEIRRPAGDAGDRSGVSAFLTIQEGCDKFCTFCVGALYARRANSRAPRSQILDEARQLVDAGAREITLLGQNVNAYHGEDGMGAWRTWLADAPLRSMPRASTRIRYTTSHPRDMDDDLIAAHARRAEADALSASARAVRAPTRCWRR